MYVNIHSSIIFYRQKLETPPMPMYRSTVAHFHNAHYLQWKGTTKIYNNIEINFKNLMVKRMHNVCSYLCETLEQAELIHSDKNQINSCLEMTTKEEKMTVKEYMGTFWGDRNVLYLVIVVATRYVCQNSLTCISKITVFYYMQIPQIHLI